MTSVWQLRRKYAATGKVRDLPRAPKRRVVTPSQDVFIRLNHLFKPPEGQTTNGSSDIPRGCRYSCAPDFLPVCNKHIKEKAGYDADGHAKVSYWPPDTDRSAFGGPDVSLDGQELTGQRSFSQMKPDLDCGRVAVIIKFRYKTKFSIKNVVLTIKSYTVFFICWSCLLSSKVYKRKHSSCMNSWYYKL